MNIFRYNKTTPFPIKGLSVAMGNFDGLHLGHKKLIHLAKPPKLNCKFGVLTFDPHPREFFSREQSSFRLMSQTAKRMKLKELGIDVLLEVPFNEELSLLEPATFVENVLFSYFKLSHLVIGEDFKFGHQRKGDANLLKSLCATLGIKVTILPLVRNDNFEISSTAIRQALKTGETIKVAEMLGDWYSITGSVIEGDKRGRTLGYPTINLDISDLHLPRFGVYSAVVKILNGKNEGSYSAAVSIGERPTYGIKQPNLEAHLLDFKDDIYGELVSVYLVSFQRDEIKFNSSEDLILQMKLDCAMAKENITRLNLV